MEVLGLFLVVFSASLHPGELRFIDELSPGTLSPDTCSQCSQIMTITTENGPNNDTQEVLRDNLNHLCGRLPVSEQDGCKSRVETYLPKIPQMPTNTEHERVQFSPQCTLCLFVVRKMENMLPKNRTEDAVVKLMGQVCDLLPHSYKHKCNNFIDKYGKQMVEFFISSAAPHSICALLHLCLLEEAPRVELLPPSSDCESCRHLVVLGGLHLGLNFSRPAQTSAFLESVCLRHPHAIPKCELFLKHFGSSLQRVLANQMDATDPCERAELCVAVKDLTSGTYRCNLGPTYWCQDMHTALMCGNVPYCKKYLWK
ncbi:hypothetical protein CRUP_035867 [Coryphaenoides rupestris]|nr:hypothetical protein CRUP_035867 [Coryphaenoides rupestris]